MESLAAKLAHFLNGKAKTKEWFCLLLLIAIIVAVFSKTIFLGKAISRIYMLANRDLLFREFSAPYFQDYDESVYLMVGPSWFLAADYIRNFELPLWNPFIGWGQPFAGDISLNAYSPLRFLFSLSPDLRFFNVLLIAPVLLSCLGTYLLARSLRISRGASIFAAISFAMCPYFLFYAELTTGTGFCYSPLVIWFFVRLANRLSLSRALAAGIASGFFVLSAHPEPAFLGITYGSVLLLAMSPITFLSSARGAGERFARSFLMLVIAGISAFCICSTFFLEFITYALHGCSYKFTASPSVIPWQTVCLNLLQPMYGGDSPFLGSFALPLAVVALVHSNHRKYLLKIISLLFLAFFLLGTRPGFLASLFQNTPVNWIPGTYCVSPIYTSVVILAAFGLDVVAKKLSDKSVCITYAVVCLVTLCVPAALFLCGFDFKVCDFEGALRYGTSFDWKVWSVNLIVLILPVGLFILPKIKLANYWVITSILIGSFVSQALVAKHSWTIAPHFEFKQNDPIPLLKKLNERIAVIGYDVLSANDYIVFKLRSISENSALVLERYENFMRFIDTGQAKFANHRPFNTVLKNNVMAKAFDMAAAPYVVSLLPVRAADDPVQFDKNDFGGRPIVFADENARFEMNSALLKYDQITSCVFGKVDWTVPRAINSTIICNLIVCDEAGNPFWFGNTQAIKAIVDSVSNSPVVAASTNVEAIVPLNLKNSQKFELRLEIRNAGNNQTIRTSEDKSFALLGKYQKSASNSSDEPHYEPIFEGRPHFIRVYRNNRAVPRAYVVHEVEQVRTPEESLVKLANNSFDPHKKVIVETKTQDHTLNFSRAKVSSATEGSTTILVDKPNRVLLSVDTVADGILVLTDTFYPGWVCKVDGQKSEILCANYVFRGVKLPAGKHEVEFCYEPLSLKIGAALLLLFVVVAPVSLLLSSRNFGRRKKLS